MNSKPKYQCLGCDYSTSKKSNWTEHINTIKHKRLDLARAPYLNPALTFDCSLCDVKCSHLSTLKRHNDTKSHKKAAEMAGNHKSDNSIMKENRELRNLIIEQATLYANNMNKVLEQNAETMNKALERCNTVNNTVNQTNNKFNINMYLNEECKNAINFSDFIKNIEVSYADLENNAQLGFVNGISKIFIDNLNSMAINERPIHCTDVKRETMYIKDDGKWNKEVDDKKLQNAIKTVSYKSLGKLLAWKGENIDYKDADSDFSIQCVQIQRQSLAGADRDVYYPKVIHLLAKETMITK
jgi:hypothetical protein